MTRKKSVQISEIRGCIMGQDRMISMNDFADLVAEIAGVEIVKKHVSSPQDVRGRNSDNTRLREILGWEPEISLEEGIARTYSWIEAQVKAMLELSSEMAESLSKSRIITS